MAKDPAFLFYPGDWQGGTMTMSRFIKGCYIDLLVAQFNSGPLSLEEIRTVLGADFGQAWPSLQKKFKQANSLFFNERLEVEKTKRTAYSQSRSKNRKKSYQQTYDKTYVQHMENENRNENTIEKEKGVQGEKIPMAAEGEADYHTNEIEIAIALAFTEKFLLRETTEGKQAYPGIDINLQLKQFLMKVRGSPDKYSSHGSSGLRQAFQAQLRTAKPILHDSHHRNHKTPQPIQFTEFAGIGKL